MVFTQNRNNITINMNSNASGQISAQGWILIHMRDMLVYWYWWMKVGKCKRGIRWEEKLLQLRGFPVQLLFSFAVHINHMKLFFIKLFLLVWTKSIQLLLFLQSLLMSELVEFSVIAVTAILSYLALHSSEETEMQSRKSPAHFSPFHELIRWP